MARRSKKTEVITRRAESLAEKTERQRNEIKLDFIINHFIQIGYYSLVKKILANPNVIGALGETAIQEYKEKIEKITSNRQDILSIQLKYKNESSQDIKDINSFFINEGTVNDNPIIEEPFFSNREIDYILKSSFFGKKEISKYGFPTIILRQDELRKMSIEELIYTFSSFFKRDFDQIDFMVNPVFNQTLRQLISYRADEFTTDDIIPSSSQQEQLYRENNIEGMVAILKTILKNYEEIGKLNTLANDENYRNETLNSIMPQNLQIVASPDALLSLVKDIESKVSNKTATQEEIVEMAVLLRQFLNKCAHDQEESLITMLRSRYRSANPQIEKKIQVQVANMSGDLFYSLKSGNRIQNKTGKKGTPIDLRLAQTDKKEKSRIIAVVSAILKQEKLSRKIDKNFIKEIAEKITACSDYKQAAVIFGSEIEKVIKELRNEEIREKIGKYVGQVRQAETHFEKISANHSNNSFYDFVREFWGAKKNKNPGFEINLKGTKKEKVYKELKKLVDEMEKDPDLESISIETIVEEMAQHAKMDREIFSLKQLITKQILRYTEYAKKIGIQLPTYIEHSLAEASTNTNSKEPRNAINIFIPNYMNMFGGHYSEADYTLEEIARLKSEYSTTDEERRREYKSNPDAYATYLPVKLTEEQINYLRKISNGIYLVEDSEKTLEEIKTEKPEEYALYEVTTPSGTINVLDKLFELKETNYEEYEKVKHQILLGAGIDIFKTYVDKQRRKAEIEAERAIQEQEEARLREAAREIEIAREEERVAAESLGEEDEISSEILIGRPELRPGADAARRAFSLSARSGEVADLESSLRADHIIGSGPNTHSNEDESPGGDEH